MATATLYPTFDGQGYIEGDTSWDNTRSGSGHSSFMGGENFEGGSQFLTARFTSPTYRLGRHFPIFDLSTLSIESISAASFVWTTSEYAEANQDIVLVQFTPSSYTAPADADWTAFGATELATRVGCGTSADTTKTFTLNASGITALNSRLGLKFGFAVLNNKDFDNSAPADNFRVGMRSMANSTVSYRPHLDITYTPSSVGGFYYMSV